MLKVYFAVVRCVLMTRYLSEDFVKLYLLLCLQAHCVLLSGAQVAVIVRAKTTDDCMLQNDSQRKIQEAFDVLCSARATEQNWEDFNNCVQNLVSEKAKLEWLFRAVTKMHNTQLVLVAQDVFFSTVYYLFARGERALPLTVLCRAADTVRDRQFLEKVYIEIGDFCMSQKQYNEALLWFKRIIRGDGDSEAKMHAHRCMSKMYATAGMMEDAEEHAVSALRVCEAKSIEAQEWYWKLFQLIGEDQKIAFLSLVIQTCRGLFVHEIEEKLAELREKLKQPTLAVPMAPRPAHSV